MTLTLTEEQAMMIRQALCRKSTEILSKAFETEDELKKLGREGEKVWEYEEHRQINQIINMIDESRVADDVVDLKIENMAMVELQ